MANQNEDLQDWKEMLLANNVPRTFSNYEAWGRGLEAWLEDEPRGRETISRLVDDLKNGIVDGPAHGVLVSLVVLVPDKAIWGAFVRDQLLSRAPVPA